MFDAKPSGINCVQLCSIVLILLGRRSRFSQPSQSSCTHVRSRVFSLLFFHLSFFPRWYQGSGENRLVWISYYPAIHTFYGKRSCPFLSRVFAVSSILHYFQLFNCSDPHLEIRGGGFRSSDPPPYCKFQGKNGFYQLGFNCTQLCSNLFRLYSPPSFIIYVWSQRSNFVSLPPPSHNPTIVNSGLQTVSINWISIVLNCAAIIFDRTRFLSQILGRRTSGTFSNEFDALLHKQSERSKSNDLQYSRFAACTVR